MAGQNPTYIKAKQLAEVYETSEHKGISGLNITGDISSRGDQIIIAQNNMIIQMLLEIDNKVTTIDNRVKILEEQLDNRATKDYEPELQKIFDKINGLSLGQSRMYKEKKTGSSPYIFRVFDIPETGTSSR